MNYLCKLSIILLAIKLSFSMERLSRTVITLSASTDGIVIIVNLSGKEFLLNLNRAATVANVTLQNETDPDSLIQFFSKDLPMLQSILKETPTIQTENILDFITAYEKKTVSKTEVPKTEAIFDCLELECYDRLPMFIRPASMDYQGLKDDRTYIVGGGTRGIGLKTVQWMASRGKLLKYLTFSSMQQQDEAACFFLHHHFRLLLCPIFVFAMHSLLCIVS